MSAAVATILERVRTLPRKRTMPCLLNPRIADVLRGCFNQREARKQFNSKPILIFKAIDGLFGEKPRRRRKGRRTP